MKSAPSIAFDVRPSRALAGAGAIGVVAAAIAPWQSALPASVRAIASILALVIGAVALARFSRPRYERVAYGVTGWTLAVANADATPAELIGHRRIASWLALEFREADRRRFRVVLGPDNSDADTRRRLALMLARAEIARPEAPV